MNRRRFSATLLSAGAAGAALAPLAGGARAGRRRRPGRRQGLHPLETPQPPGAPPGKIEVLEFFSYACPHCSAFEPAIEAWEKPLPADVVLRRVPVPFLMNADNFMHTYYALETIGAVEAVQLKIFRAIHIERKRLEKAENIAAFVGKNGVDAAKFLAAFKSFSVATSVARAKKMMADYKVESVPTLVVQGRWVTSPSLAGCRSGRSRSSTAWCSACASPDATPRRAGRRSLRWRDARIAARSRQDRRPARRLERLHDVRLVRPPEVPRAAAVVIAALVSWGIALFEYLLQVPGNRIGYESGMTLAQLKITQEVITLARLRSVRARLHEAAAQARLSLGRPVPGRRGVFRLPVGVT